MSENLQNCEDLVWSQIVEIAAQIASNEPPLKDLMEEVVFGSSSLAECIAKRIARKMSSRAVPAELITKTMLGAFDQDESVMKKIVCDIMAINQRDPACRSLLDPIMYYKGFQAVCCHRVAHVLWHSNRKELARYLQSLTSEIFAVDIHPAARFGGGIMLDHATSFVAGETCVVEDNVSILHEVTLGGTGSKGGDRHPKVRSGVLIGSGAKLIGNIEIGKGAKIGAGSVVLDDVPEHTTVAGVPAKQIGVSKEENPSIDMNQNLDCRCDL